MRVSMVLLSRVLPRVLMCVLSCMLSRVPGPLLDTICIPDPEGNPPEENPELETNSKEVYPDGPGIPASDRGTDATDMGTDIPEEGSVLADCCDKGTNTRDAGDNVLGGCGSCAARKTNGCDSGRSVRDTSYGSLGAKDAKGGVEKDAEAFIGHMES